LTRAEVRTVLYIIGQMAAEVPAGSPGACLASTEDRDAEGQKLLANGALSVEMSGTEPNYDESRIRDCLDGVPVTKQVVFAAADASTPIGRLGTGS
jgi:hypothetical protein